MIVLVVLLFLTLLLGFASLPGFEEGDGVVLELILLVALMGQMLLFLISPLQVFLTDDLLEGFLRYAIYPDSLKNGRHKIWEVASTRFNQRVQVDVPALFEVQGLSRGIDVCRINIRGVEINRLSRLFFFLGF